jgi:DNA-binding transcriptional MerR regulator
MRKSYGVVAEVRTSASPATAGLEPESERRLLHIGEVARRVGLSLRTVRYYDEVGLVTPSGRTDGGFRLYSEDDVQRLLVVKGMKPFGLTLEEMRELVELLDRSARSEQLDESALRELHAGLAAYAERGDKRLERIERDLRQARDLRIHIAERLGRCDMHLSGTAVPATRRAKSR